LIFSGFKSVSVILQIQEDAIGLGMELNGHFRGMGMFTDVGESFL
jgi:hypothetical protein